MSKQKKLPDHRIEATNLLTELTESRCEELKIIYGFNNDFKLYEKLLDSFQKYEFDKETVSKSLIKEQIELLEALEKRCKLTVECIDHLGSIERDALINKFGPNLDFDDLRFKLDILAVHSSSIASELKPNIPKGKPSDPSINPYLSRLVNIYVDGTGREAECWYYPQKSKYSGKFFKFVSEIFVEFGVKEPNSGLAQKIISVKKSLGK